MSLTGNATTDQKLRGKINRLYELRGYSAYEIAMIHGFKGTEEEWLASLKGEKGADGYTPVCGIDYWTNKDKAEIESYIDNKFYGILEATVE